MIIAVVFLAVAAMIIYPIATGKWVSKDKKAANKVVTMIETLAGKEIGEKNEKEIASVKTEYDALTAKQKTLVSNLDVFEAAIKKGISFKDRFLLKSGPNEPDMYVSRFSKVFDGFGIASCEVTFAGFDAEFGDPKTLYGVAVIRNDGTLYYTLAQYR